MAMTPKKIRLLEFLLIGILMGVLEDLIAVVATTGKTINFSVVGIVFLVALPFAFLSEIIVDHPRFWKTIFKLNEVKK